MARFSSQKLAEQYEKLPEKLKEAVYSEDIALKLFDLGRKYGITIEKNGFLAEEVGYVILGLEKPEEFPKFVKERLDFDDEETAEIVKDINQQIFMPIREALKRAHQIEIAAEEAVPRPLVGIPATEDGLGRIGNQEPETTKPFVVGLPPKPAGPTAVKPPVPEIQPGHFLDKKELEDLKRELRNKKQEVRPVTEQKLEPRSKDREVRANEAKKLEPVPPPAKPKLPPIDLRQGSKPRPALPQFTGGAIFAPPAQKEESVIKNKEDAILTPPPQLKVPEQKSPLRTYDPYKEPIE